MEFELERERVGSLPRFLRKGEEDTGSPSSFAFSTDIEDMPSLEFISSDCYLIMSARELVFFLLLIRLKLGTFRSASFFRVDISSDMSSSFLSTNILTTLLLLLE